MLPSPPQAFSFLFYPFFSLLTFFFTFPLFFIIISFWGGGGLYLFVFLSFLVRAEYFLYFTFVVTLQELDLFFFAVMI